MSDPALDMPVMSINQLASNISVGDLIFIRVSAAPFKAVADITGTWTNHCGVVIDTNGSDPCIGESTFPLSRTTTFSKFIARSEQGQVAVCRLKFALTAQQMNQLQQAVQRRSGIFYDTGFNMRSRRLFCSRFVHEVINEATGISVGKVETLREMVARKANPKLGFWRLWYFGHIPWEREIITPVSLLQSPELDPVFHGKVMK